MGIIQIAKSAIAIPIVGGDFGPGTRAAQTIQTTFIDDLTAGNSILVALFGDGANGTWEGGAGSFIQATSGGALPLRTYYLAVSFVTSLGETMIGPVTALTIPANNLAQVTAPNPNLGTIPGATSWNLYYSSSGAAGTFHKVGNFATNVSWTEPTSGVTAVGSPPSRPIFDSAGDAFTPILWVDGSTPHNAVMAFFIVPVAVGGGKVTTIQFGAFNNNPFFTLQHDVSCFAVEISGTPLTAGIDSSAAAVFAAATLSVTVTDIFASSVVSDFGSQTLAAAAVCCISVAGIANVFFAIAGGFGMSSAPAPTLTGGLYTLIAQETSPNSLYSYLFVSTPLPIPPAGPDAIGGITVPEIDIVGVFPLVTDFTHTQQVAPTVAIHPFISGNAKIEQRFELGNGSRRWTGIWHDLYESDLEVLKDFWDSRRGPYQAFTLNVPSDDSLSSDPVTVVFEDAPLTWDRLIQLVSQVGITFVEIPSAADAPVYDVAATVSRFPSGTLETALEAQVQQIIPLVKITPKKAGYPVIYLSDRRCTIGSQLYQARLLTWDGISQTLAGGPGDAAASQSDVANFTFGNADKVMRDLAADVDLFRASIEFSLFHVGTTIKCDLWKGEVVDYQSTSQTEFALAAVDGLYDVTLQYPVDKVSAKCGKRYDDGLGCPFSATGGGHTAGALDLVNFPAADAGSCDRGYLTDNGCKAHTMKRFFGGLVTDPQSVRIKDNSSGFFGFGRSTITATSLVADSVLGQPLREIYTDVPMPVDCLIVSGRDESDFYEALGIVGAGPLQAYGRGYFDSAGNPMLHTLDGQPNHGYPGTGGLREVLGSDPAGATDFLSLDQSGNQAGSDTDKVFSGASTFADHYSAGVAFVVIRRTDTKGIQLTTLDQHAMQAIVAQGLQGWIWTAPGVRTMQTLTNPVWLAINLFLRGSGLRFADASTAEQYFDLTSALAAAAICDLSVDKIIGAGTETQFKFQGVLKDLKVLRDWIQEVLNNALGCWVFSNGKLKITIREDAAAAASFSGGNIIMGSLQLGPVRPAFNRLTVAFANSEYSFVADTLPVTDEDHVDYLGRVLDSNLNLSGAAGKSMAGRIGATRLKEELGGVGAAEWKAARTASWKTTVLALGVEPGIGVSIDDDDVPGGTGLFRVLKWTLAPDYSIQLSGRTITDSMYDAVAGPKAVDVPSNKVPVEYFPYPLKSAWCPDQASPPVGDGFFDQYDRTFELQLTATQRTDKGQTIRAIVSGSLAVNDFIPNIQPVIIRATDFGTSTGHLKGRRNYWAQAFARAADGRWSPGSNIRHFTFEDVGTNSNWIEISGIEWPAGTWATYVLFVGDDEKTICAQVESANALTVGNARHFTGPDRVSWGNHAAFVITGDLTLGIWARFSSITPPTVDQWIAAYGAESGIGVDNMLYGLRVKGSAGAWDIGYRHHRGEFTADDQIHTFATAIPDDTWVFIALRRAGSAVEVLTSYDGLTLVSAGSWTYTHAPDGGDGSVPKLNIGNDEHFGTGVVADLDAHYVWARALANADILKLAGGNLSGVASHTGLELACDLGDTTEVDLSPNGFTSTIEGTSIIGDGVGPATEQPSSFTFNGPLRESTYNAPSPAHKFVRVKVKRALHAGTVGAVVTALDTVDGAVTFAGLAGTLDDWTGRKLYWAADMSDGIADPIHFTITAYNPSTGLASLSPDPIAAGVGTGDLFYFRCVPNVFSSDGLQIGDTKIVNGIYPTGAVVDAEIGHVVRGVTAGRPHQIRRIVSNTSHVYTVDKPFEWQPDYFTVELANWEYFAESTPVDVPNTGIKAAIAASIDNLPNQPIVVGAFLVDRLNEETPEDFAVIRDSYVFGADAAAVLSSKGDILSHDGTGDVPFPVGSDDQMLVADSAAPEGLVWVDQPVDVNSTKHGLAPIAPADATKFLNGAATPAYALVKDSDLSTSDVSTNNVSSTKHGFTPKAPADATKFLNGAATPAFALVKDSDLSTSDITTNDVSSTKHGFAPKAPADATKFLNGAATPAFALVKDSDLSTSDITTNDVSITKHGFAPKAPNDATKYLDGTGAYSVPAGGAGGLYTVNPAGVSGIYALFYADQGCYVDAGVTLATAGQTIQQWNDQSGNGRNLSQATSGKRPTYQTAGGPPGLTNRTVWAGGQCLQLASAALSTFTIFSLFRGATPNGIVYEHSANASSNPGCYLYTDISSSIEVNRNPSNTISARNNGSNWGIQKEWYLVTHRYGGTHATHSFGAGSWLSQGIITDTTFSADPGSATVTDTLNVGSRNNAGSVAFTGDLVALVVFTPFISMANVQGIVAFLLNKYNVLG